MSEVQSQLFQTRFEHTRLSGMSTWLLLDKFTNTMLRELHLKLTLEMQARGVEPISLENA